jgi:hypothetical protein
MTSTYPSRTEYAELVAASPASPAGTVPPYEEWIKQEGPAQRYAIARLEQQGYKAVASEKRQGAVMVLDPYCGYNSGKYAVDGYNEVTLYPAEVTRFLNARS